MRNGILQYLKDNDTGDLISLNDKLKELLGNRPLNNLISLLRDIHTEGVAVISGNYGWLGGAQDGIPHTLNNIPILGRILPKGIIELKENEIYDSQQELTQAQIKDIPENRKYRKWNTILIIISILEALAIALITINCKK